MNNNGSRSDRFGSVSRDTEDAKMIDADGRGGKGILQRLLCNHDYVVVGMEFSPYQPPKAWYTLECSECNKRREGHASELPNARFV